MTQENQTKKFFIYARKSTDSEDRQVRSINDQIAELRELAKKENLEVVDLLVEKQTAKKPGRPMFAEMLKRIEAGEATGILAWHPFMSTLICEYILGGKIARKTAILILSGHIFLTAANTPILNNR